MRTTVIRIKHGIKGQPKQDDFTLDSYSLPTELKQNEILLKALWISVDPGQRGRLTRARAGTIIKSPQIAQVIKSNSARFQVGDIISGIFKWSTYSIYTDRPNKSVFQTVSIAKAYNLQPNMDLSKYMGPLGIVGLTAYQGLFDIGKLSKGETVFVSGAAGAVGSIVGQIAKHIMGCTVIGTAGNNDKCKWLTETLGFDKALNYKTYNNNISKFRKDLSKSFGNKGIDLYFDNTGGFQTEAIWDLLNYKGRVIVCGQIANYNKMLQQPKINDFLYKLIYKHIRIEGFAITSFKRYKQFYKDMNQWMDEGKIVYRKTVKCGFDQVPSAFMGLFTGENTGKMLVKISDPQIIKSKL
eukprot:235805_1